MINDIAMRPASLFEKQSICLCCLFMLLEGKRREGPRSSATKYLRAIHYHHYDIESTAQSTVLQNGYQTLTARLEKSPRFFKKARGQPRVFKKAGA